MPKGMEQLSVLRIVVRNGFSRDLAGMLVRDLRTVTEHLQVATAASLPMRVTTRRGQASTTDRPPSAKPASVAVGPGF